MSDIEESQKSIREMFSPVQRNEDMYMSIDPGFVHRSKIMTVIGPNGEAYINKRTAGLPADTPDWEARVRVDHYYKDALIFACDAMRAPTMAEMLGNGYGTIFSSIEQTEPTKDIWSGNRVRTIIKKDPVFSEYEVCLDYSSSRVTSDTIKSQLADGDELAIIAQLHKKDGKRLIFHPLVIGAPLLISKSDKSIIDDSEAMWYSYEFFENFVEDID
jgi:hypothetical protein